MSSSAAESPVFQAVRPPAAPQFVVKAGVVDHFLVKMLSWGVFGAIVLQKFALAEFEVVWFWTMGVLGVLLYYGRLRISTHRLVLYTVTMVLAVFSNAFAREGTLSSLVLTMLVCFPYVAVVDASAETRLAFLQRVQLIGLIICGCILIDLVVQPLGMRMPSLEAFMPESTVYHNYVYIQPMFWQSPYDKPNGLFFLEASYLSQFMAICLIIELAYFRRMKYMIPYGLSMLGINAGTGFVLLFVSLPFVVWYYLTPRMIALGLTVVLVVGGVAIESGFVERALQRSAEFDHHGASGNARFVAPFASFAEQFTTAPTSDLIWGYGAGTQSKSTDIMLIPPTKMILEFGLATCLTFLFFAFTAMFEGSRSFFAVTWVVMIDCMFLNGATVQPITATIGVLLASIWGPRRDRVVLQNRVLEQAEPDRPALAGPVFQ